MNRCNTRAVDEVTWVLLSIEFGSWVFQMHHRIMAWPVNGLFNNNVFHLTDQCMFHESLGDIHTPSHTPPNELSVTETHNPFLLCQVLVSMNKLGLDPGMSNLSRSFLITVLVLFWCIIVCRIRTYSFYPFEQKIDIIRTRIIARSWNKASDMIWDSSEILSASIM